MSATPDSTLADPPRIIADLQRFDKHQQASHSQDPEYELLDTGIFNEDRYFDVFVEYANAVPTDLMIEISGV
jgi:hypothetical protein